MVSRDNLRKRHRLGGVGLVAANAQHSRIELSGRHRRRVVRVFCQRTMARFATDVRMFTIFLLIENVGVAALAGGVTCIIHRPRRNFRQRISAIVPVFAKTSGNQKSSNDQEEQQARGKYPKQPEKMSRIFECVHSKLRPRLRMLFPGSHFCFASAAADGT